MLTSGDSPKQKFVCFSLSASLHWRDAQYAFWALMNSETILPNLRKMLHAINVSPRVLTGVLGIPETCDESVIFSAIENISDAEEFFNTARLSGCYVHTGYADILSSEFLEYVYFGTTQPDNAASDIEFSFIKIGCHQSIRKYIENNFALLKRLGAKTDFAKLEHISGLV